jgi:hypothetical protein
MSTATFAMIFGIAYLGAGVLGLIPAALTPPPTDAPPTTFAVMYGYLLGLFPVNILHSAVHIAIGIWGLIASRSLASAKVYGRSLAILYGALAVMGLIPGVNTLFGMLPIHGHDVWLHGATAAIAAYFGWRHEAVAAERRAAVDDRRRQGTFVASDRRGGLEDRRSGHLSA